MRKEVNGIAFRLILLSSGTDTSGFLLRCKSLMFFDFALSGQTSEHMNMALSANKINIVHQFPKQQQHKHANELGGCLYYFQEN